MSLAIHKEGVGLEQEVGTARFFGVKVIRNYEHGLLEIIHDVIINTVIEALVFDDGAAKVKCTLVETNPLIKEKDSLQVSVQFSYSSFVGIIM